MMHHDQSKIIPNEFIYHSDGRYFNIGMDDNMMDELIIPGTEQAGSELNHLDNGLNKNTIMCSSSNYLMTEDYFNNNFSYNNTSNINPNMNLSNNQSNQQGNSQYSFHTLQPASGSNTSSSSQMQQSNQSYQYMQSNSNTPYITLGATANSSLAGSSGLINTNGSLHGSATYIPKLITRTPSFNSSLGGSSASSPSSLSSSSNSLNNIPQSLHGSTLNQTHSNNTNASYLNSNHKELLDYESIGQTTSTNTSAIVNNSTQPQANDPAEQARLKHMRGQKLTPEEYQLLVKDRQRKDNHNMIERRRRFNINDRIKELGQLLPKDGEFDTKQNKGSILKASVDYITQIKHEVDELRKTAESNKYMLTLNKKLCNRIKELEMLCRSHGINVAPQSNQLINNNFNNNNNYLINAFNKNDNHSLLIQDHQAQFQNDANLTTNHQNIHENHINLTYSSPLSTSSLNTLQETQNNNIKLNNLDISSLNTTTTITNQGQNYTNNSNDALNSNNLLQNQEQQQQQIPQQQIGTKKQKTGTRKRNNPEVGQNEVKKTKMNRQQSQVDSKDIKFPKQEPISPKNKINNSSELYASQTSLEFSNQLHNQVQENSAENSLITINKVPTSPKYIINNKLSNGINGLTTIHLKSNETNECSSHEISSPSITSTSPLIKLMTSNSKDPILTSSSVSSPSSSPSPTSSTTPSSSSTSSSSTASPTTSLTKSNSAIFFASNKSPTSPSSSSSSATTSSPTCPPKNPSENCTNVAQISCLVSTNDCFNN